jgi:hypothetical protein
MEKLLEINFSRMRQIKSKNLIHFLHQIKTEQ